jgi:DNA polymerase-4
MDRTILHCDLNSFYASVELLEHPELRQSPVAVCGDPKSRHGIILAKNEPAKAQGVKTAETIWQARQKCPGLALLPAHHDKYRHFSQLVNTLYGRYTDLVEPFGIDESWLDVTGSMHLFGGSGLAVAEALRQTVKSEFQLTISVGVSFNKVFAKLGSDYKKPDAVTVISRENYRQLVWPLPVSDLLFVGRAAAKTLASHGIRTIGDLAAADREALVALLGKHGSQLYEYATGAEHSPVAPQSRQEQPKSVGNGNTFRRNLVGWEEIRPGVAMLCESVAQRLRRQGLKCTSLQVTIRDPNFKDICRQKRLSTPTYLSRELFQGALELIAASWTPTAPIRALTVTALGLLPEEEAGEQLDLFSTQSPLRRERLEQLERTVDGIRTKYGRAVISPASLSRPFLQAGDGQAEELDPTE